jgi:hypothetical protein
MDDVNIGWNTLVSKKANKGMKKRTVQCIKLSQYIIKNNLKEIDAIKIDVEGHEYYVLEDLYDVIKQLDYLPLILVEIGWGKNNPVYSKLISLLDNYFDLGYKKVKIDHDKTFDLILDPING